MSDAIRVLIADDHAVVREGLRHVLSVQPEFQVVAEAGTGAEAVRLAKSERPDVIVLDISMPDGNGLETLATLRASVPEARVLMLSIHDSARYVLESVRAGAHGYLSKDSTPSELRAAVRALHAGDRYFAPAMAARIQGDARDDNADRGSRIAQLTPRERDVLTGIVEGLTNKEIAARLRISSRTVESHRENLMVKLGARNAAALTRLALEEGIAGP